MEICEECKKSASEYCDKHLMELIKEFCPICKSELHKGFCSNCKICISCG